MDKNKDIQVVPDCAIADGRRCIGAKNHNADIMITFHKKEKEYTVFYDFFLNTAQAERLKENLEYNLKWNNEDD